LFGVPGIEYDNKPYNKGACMADGFHVLGGLNGISPWQLSNEKSWFSRLYRGLYFSLISLPIRNLLKYGNGLGRDSLEGVPTVGGPLEKSLKLETSNT